jgi:hypothetical protein
LLWGSKLDQPLQQQQDLWVSWPWLFRVYAEADGAAPQSKWHSLYKPRLGSFYWITVFQFVICFGEFPEFWNGCLWQSHPILSLRWNLLRFSFHLSAH